MSSRRDTLLAVAADLFVRYGFRRTSVEDMARAAGVSKGAFYLEFPSKDALFEALVRHEVSTYLAAARLRIEADPEGGRLSRIYHHCIAELLDRDFLRALYRGDEHVLGGLLQRGGPDRYRPRVLLGGQFLARLQRAGLVRDAVDPDTLSHTLSVLTVGPLLAEPLLHADDAPPLGATFEALSAMITTCHEAPGGDVEEGRRAFVELVEAMTAALAEPLLQ